MCLNRQIMICFCMKQGWKKLGKKDHRSYKRNFWRLRKESLKSSGLYRIRTSAIQVQRSSNWTNKPSGSRSLNWLVINLWKDDDGVTNIWKSYIWFDIWYMILQFSYIWFLYIHNFKNKKIGKIDGKKIIVSLKTFFRRIISSIERNQNCIKTF